MRKAEIILRGEIDALEQGAFIGARLAAAVRPQFGGAAQRPQAGAAARLLPLIEGVYPPEQVIARNVAEILHASAQCRFHAHIITHRQPLILLREPYSRNY